MDIVSETSGFEYKWANITYPFVFGSPAPANSTIVSLIVSLVSGIKETAYRIKNSRAPRGVFYMVGTTELESVTSCLSSRRSNQLSYAP